MNSPLNISITEVSKEGLSIETSILKDGATINFDKELEKAKNKYEELLKELIDNWNPYLNKFDIFTTNSWNKVYNKNKVVIDLIVNRHFSIFYCILITNSILTAIIYQLKDNIDCGHFYLNQTK